MNNIKPIYAIGVMSGTSTDGIDIALCSFEKKLCKWNYKLLKFATYSFSSEWKNILQNASKLNTFDFLMLHNNFGELISDNIKKFINGVPVKISLIASHGHTIFHEPDKKITFQIGNGNTIAANTGITTITDFRSFDVALNGQGAPLVPIGDELLFNSYSYCLNLGGIANVSYNENGNRIAFDVCVVNMAINFLTNTINKEYDKDGLIATKGKINIDLLNKLNNLDFFKSPHPKSLGREWFESNICNLITDNDLSLEDKLRTFYEHIAIQICKVIKSDTKNSVLVTGGGAYNKFLIDLICQKTKSQIIIPQNDLIEFKEAIIFAFLGVLRFYNETNVLSSVTGAKCNSSSGNINLIK